jgi:hypothetical protein
MQPTTSTRTARGSPARTATIGRPPWERPSNSRRAGAGSDDEWRTEDVDALGCATDDAHPELEPATSSIAVSATVLTDGAYAVDRCAIAS